jgi:penicillin V acylase-like amidase (Ntn superfamily)
MYAKPRRLLFAFFLFLVPGLVLPPPARPCSSFAFPNKGFLVFGTNYDNRFAPGFLFVNKRGVRKSGWEAGTTGRTASWVSRFGSVTISCAGYQLAWGGMNEAGLVFSTMALGGTRVPPPDDRPPLVGAFWWQFMLDTCATIEDVREASKSVRISDTGDHYLVCDRTGAVAVVECLSGQLAILTGKDVPIAALANAPYQVCLEHWETNAPGPVNPYDSRNRFSRLAQGLARRQEGTAAAAVGHAFGLLAGVSASDTRWSFVCDTGNRVFHLKTYKNPKVRSVDLGRIDFSCARPTAMIDAHSGDAGDITGSFHSYSHDEVAAHMLEALKISPELVRQVLGHFEGFLCEPGAPAAGAAPAQARTKPALVFDFSFEVSLPATPIEVYDALTGDISGWWDHSFADRPYRLYIEPKPGGGFYEIFDRSGDGARHATVILAERGKRLRFDGPLGLSGQAISMVTSYDLVPSGPGATLLKVSVHGAGEMDDRAPGAVESVWKHFILERFRPYVESGAHKKPRR